MSSFYNLKIKNISRLTIDAVEITFDIPTNHKNVFHFKAGQYITIKSIINSEEIRRAYSLCSSPNNQEISIGVKKVVGGKMSGFLTEKISVGDVLEVMPPSGNFILREKAKHVVGICAGSGITPILSMIKSSNQHFTLIYGNKTPESAMFLNEIIDLAKKSNRKITPYFAYSRKKIDGSYPSRINVDVLDSLAEKSNLLKADEYFICGPGEMIDSTSEFLVSKGIDKENIHFERFASVKKDSLTSVPENKESISNVTVIIDGEEFVFQLNSSGKSILDAAIEQGADIPFSCKGAVCCTCKAKIITGESRMDQNYALSEEEVSQGYLLTCQAHPVSEEITIDFDEI